MTLPAKARSEPNIRRFDSPDWPDVWTILEPIFRAGETYAVPPDVSENDARRCWTGGANEVFVAEEPATGRIVGTYYIRPNYDGPASHVCNCGYAVAEIARGKGIASCMCEHSQQHAVARGFRSMQFNLVAASNESAVRLWITQGFNIVGTLPDAFRHPTLGFVDAHVMFKSLRPGARRDPSPRAVVPRP
jgi:ribosomal protein S18 acetylase RimI-like enzyme